MDLICGSIHSTLMCNHHSLENAMKTIKNKRNLEHDKLGQLNQVKPKMQLYLVKSVM